MLNYNLPVNAYNIYIIGAALDLLVWTQASSQAGM